MKKEEFRKITVDGKEYKLGYPTRKSAKEAEKLGLVIGDSGKLLTFMDKMFYTALHSYQESITEDEAERIEEKYLDELAEARKHDEMNKLIEFLTKSFVDFIKPQNG